MDWTGGHLLAAYVLACITLTASSTVMLFTMRSSTATTYSRLLNVSLCSITR